MATVNIMWLSQLALFFSAIDDAEYRFFTTVQVHAEPCVQYETHRRRRRVFRQPNAQSEPEFVDIIRTSTFKVRSHATS